MVLDKIFQSVIACNSLYGLIGLSIMCLTIIVIVLIVTTTILRFTKTYNYVHAKFNGMSIQSEIDLHDKDKAA